MSPVVAHVQTGVLAAHRLDVDLRMADEHLDAQVQLQDARGGEVILHRVLQAADKGREEIALLWTEERQIMPVVLRRCGHLGLKKRDGPAQDNGLGQNPEGRVDGVAAEPVRQVLEVRNGILNRCSAEDPLARTANGTKSGVAPGLLAVADVVALIQDNAVPRIVVNDVLVAPQAIVGRQKDNGVARSTPRALRELAERDSALLECGRPLLDENRGRNEQSCGDRCVAQQANGLPRLAESHVVGKDTATAELGSALLPLEHPAHTLLLVREVGEPAVRLLESRHSLCLFSKRLRLKNKVLEYSIFSGSDSSGLPPTATTARTRVKRTYIC